MPDAPDVSPISSFSLVLPGVVPGVVPGSGGVLAQGEVGSAPSVPGGFETTESAPGGTGEDLPPPTVPGGGAGAPGGGFFQIILFGFLGLMIFMIFSQGRAAKRERLKKQEMLSALKRHDRVMTGGGIIGSVVEIRGDEITLETDKASGTRIRFATSAVQQVLRSASGGGNDPDQGDGETDDAEKQPAGTASG